jgi:hypothetical protein
MTPTRRIANSCGRQRLSLAQLNQKDVAPTILMLLDRKELSELRGARP